MPTVLVEAHGHVCLIRLNRPDDANCINADMATALAEAAVACDTDPGVRAVILTGSGKFFCAGGDVKAMAELGDGTAAAMKRMADELHRAISAFSRMKAPLVVAVNGAAAGAGFSLAAVGDIVLVDRAARFTMAYTKIGLSPDGSSSYFLPRLIGLRRTQELMLTNRTLSAHEAVEIGVATSVVEQDDLLRVAMETATRCAAGGPDAQAAVKSLLLASFTNSLETQMELEGRYIAACASTPNGREGIRSFIEKRSPRFG